MFITSMYLILQYMSVVCLQSERRNCTISHAVLHFSGIQKVLHVYAGLLIWKSNKSDATLDLHSPHSVESGSDSVLRAYQLLHPFPLCVFSSTLSTVSSQAAPDAATRQVFSIRPNLWLKPCSQLRHKWSISNVQAS